MSATQVTTANSNSFLNAARTVFRDSNGIPYILNRASGTTFETRKGVIAFNESSGSYYKLLNGTNTAASQSFVGTGGTIRSLKMTMQTSGSPTGNAYVKIYAHSGTYGTSSIPTGAALATSNALDVSTLGGGYQRIWFTFDTPFVTSEGTNYTVVFEYTNGNSSNYIALICTSSSVIDGNAAYYDGSWHPESSYDLWVDLPSDKPSSWVSISPYTAGTAIEGVSGAIDSNDVLHISWIDDQGKASPLMYATIDVSASTPTLSTATLIADLGEDPATGTLYTAIAIDANDIPHIAFTLVDRKAPQGLAYINKVGGTWNTEVDVYVVDSVSTKEYDIVLDMDNNPIILTKQQTTFTYAYLGNANNATSFTAQSLGGVVGSGAPMGITITPNGNVVSGYLYNGIVLRVHTYGASWSTWVYAASNSTIASNTSLVAVGEFIYVFYEKSTGEICYDIYDIDGDSWAGETVLETTADPYNSVRAKWGFWVDNDSQGALVEKTLVDNSTNVGSFTPSPGYVGQSFSGNGQTLGLFYFGLNLIIANSATIYAKIYEIATLTSDYTTGTLVHTSTGRDLTGVPTGSRYVDFKFPELVTFDSSKKYIIVIDVNGSTNINFVRSGNNDAFDGQAYYSGSYTATYDMAMYLLTRGNNEPTELDYAFVDETATPDIWFNTLSLETTHNASVAMSGSGTLDVISTLIATNYASTAMNGVGTLDAIGTKEIQASVAANGTGVLTVIGTSELDGSISLNANGTLSIVGDLTRLATIALNGAGTLNVNGQVTSVHLAQIVLDGVGSFSAIGTIEKYGTITLDGAGALAIAGLIEKQASVAADGVSTLAISGKVDRIAKVSMSGTGTLDAIGDIITLGKATLNGTGTLIITGQTGGLHQAAATLNGTGALSVNAENIVTGIITISGVGSVTIVAENSVFGSVAANGTGLLTVNAINEVTGSVAMSGNGVLSANATKELLASTLADGTGDLVVNSTKELRGSIVIDGVGTLSAVAEKTLLGNISLISVGGLTVTGSNGSSASAVLDGIGTLAVNGNIETAASVSFAGIGSMTAIGGTGVSASVSINGTSSLGINATKVLNTSIVVAGTGNASASGMKELFNSVALSASAGLNINGIKVLQGSVVYNGAGIMTATYSSGLYASPKFNGVTYLNIKAAVHVLDTASILDEYMETLEYLSFNNTIIIDTANLTTRSVSGIDYPTGTLKQPVDNIVDAVAIANTKFIKNITVIGDLTIGDEVPISGIKFNSFDKHHSTITINSNATLTECIFDNITVYGYIQDGSIISNSIAIDVTYVDGLIKNSVLGGTLLLLNNTGECNIVDCGTQSVDEVTIDMNGDGKSLKLSNFNGIVKLTNKTGGEVVYIDLNSGGVKLTDTVINGVVHCRGVGQIIQDLSRNTMVYDSLVDMSGMVKPPAGIPRINIVG